MAAELTMPKLSDSMADAVILKWLKTPGEGFRRGDALLELEPERYVARLTGRRVGRSRKVCCPLHEDGTPSLHVYREPERGWYCFGCRRGGSVYDLAAAMWRVDPRGAGFVVLRQRLTAMFG